MEKENKKTIEIPFGAKDSELYKFEYTIPEGYEAEIKDGKVIVKKKKDSEDERIRKDLVNYFHGAPLEHPEKEVLAWLEKQKEPQNNSDAPNESSWEGTTSSSDNGRNLDELAREYIDGVKQYHPTPTWDLMQTAVCYGYHLGEEVGSEGVESVKPIEWSEEDEAAYNAFICEVINEKMNPTIEQIKWLRSICDRLKFDHDREQQPAKEDGPFDEDKFLEGELAAFLQNYDKEYDDDAAISDVAIHFYELGKKIKQKPAAWSDSVAKEMFIKALERAVEQTKKGYELTDCDKHSWWEDFKAYSGIKPADWSKEDKHCIHQLILFCENCMQQDSEAIRCATWLKSLRPQPHWKPSEYQMKALYSLVLDGGITYVSQLSYLKSLYEDLKKL